MKLALNLAKSNTFAFFDPQSRLHLTVSSPVGVVNGATPAIERGLKSKTLILLDEPNEVPKDNTPNGVPANDEISPEVPVEPLEAPQVPVEPPVPEVPVEVPPVAPEASVEVPAESKRQKKGRGKKTTTE